MQVTKRYTRSSPNTQVGASGGAEETEVQNDVMEITFAAPVQPQHDDHKFIEHQGSAKCLEWGNGLRPNTSDKLSAKLVAARQAAETCAEELESCKIAQCGPDKMRAEGITLIQLALPNHASSLQAIAVR